jgi:hypothetical protein
MSLILDEGILVLDKVILEALTSLKESDKDAEKLSFTACTIGIGDYVSIGDKSLMYDAECDGISIYNEVLDSEYSVELRPVSLEDFEFNSYIVLYAKKLKEIGVSAQLMSKMSQIFADLTRCKTALVSKRTLDVFIPSEAQEVIKKYNIGG